VSAPDPRGLVTVSGVAPPRSLVIIQNRGLSALGERAPRQRFGQVADDLGNFSFARLSARGDDELVVQARDLLGYRSASVSVLVPDAELAGIDVIGAFAWETLTNGRPGVVAVNLAPFGVDGRGICPDSKESHDVCFTGGMTHAMVALENVTVDGEPVNPLPARTSTAAPYNRGLEGDVRAGPRDVVVLVDLGSLVGALDEDGRRFAAIGSFVESMRRRDRVAVMAYGESVERLTVALEGGVYRETGLRAFEERRALTDALRALAARTPGGPTQPGPAVEVAAEMLREEARSTRARIVVITGPLAPATDAERAEMRRRASRAVAQDPDTGFPGYTVDVVALGLPPGARELEALADLAAFSGGALFSASLDGLQQSLADLGAVMSGSFILLYELPIPERSGKSATIRFDLESFLGGTERVRTSHVGPLRIQNSSNP
jgi:hypothetical protein